MSETPTNPFEGLNVTESAAIIALVTDAEQLVAMLAAETAGEDRKGVKDAIEARRAELAAPPAAAKPAVVPPAPAARKKGAVVVAAGKSITSKRGIIGPGEEVTAKDLGGGDARIKELVEAGVLCKG